jgi:hypothetical protein
MLFVSPRVRFPPESQGRRNAKRIGVRFAAALSSFYHPVTGIREPARHLTYKGSRGVVTSRDVQRDQKCFTCACVRGQRERANILRYALPNEGGDAAA